jgi:hypothetical protein
MRIVRSLIRHFKRFSRIRKMKRLTLKELTLKDCVLRSLPRVAALVGRLFDRAEA